jgi:hypothetical protein
MALVAGLRARERTFLFVRIGWMYFYNGSVPGDERPIGGGRYNKSNVGHEVYNYRETDGKLYGYFQPPMASLMVALERIDAEATDTDALDGVLVIYVARRPEGGQVIVGWYRDATVLREVFPRSPGKPKGFGHFCVASAQNCVLLPEDNRAFEVPRGAGGMGMANICYPLNAGGEPKRLSWMQAALTFVDEYDATNIFNDPSGAAEKESAAVVERALARSKGQGFARTAKERRAIENHAMADAKKYFREIGYEVEDVSARRSYDLLCRQGGEELHVEVKGTTTEGDAIVLTYNEVKHACDGNHSCALFVLHSISLTEGQASGGESHVVLPWHLQQENLTPVTYTYRVR